MGRPREMGSQGLGTVLLFLLVIIGGGVFELVGFHLVYKLASYTIAAFFVIAPPVGALIYLITRFRA